MQVTREDLNPCTIKLSVTAAPDQVKGGFDKAYKSFAKRLRIPGFRPGHAPRHLVAQMVDPNDILNSAAEEIVRNTLNEALKAEKIRPHDRPAVELTSIDESEQKCEYVAKIPLEPQVKLGEYKGVEIKRPKTEVTDEEVDQQLEELRKRSGKRETVTDRGLQEGDNAVVNIKIDGEEGEGKNFVIVVGQTFKGLDGAITGMKVEEMTKVDLSFPKEFQEKEWAGKKKKAQVTIRSANSVVMPELDDEFAKGLKGKELKSKDLSELKEKLKENILKAKQTIGQEYVTEALFEEILKSSEVHVPDTMWESVAAQRLREEAENGAREGKKLEEVAKDHGMELDEYVAKWQAEAKAQVQRAVLANTIFKQEGMKLTNQDFTESLNEMAMEYGVHPGQLFEFMKKNKNFTELEVRSVYRKVMAFLTENAKIVEV